MEKTFYSTSEVLFCNRTFFFKTENDALVEEKSILHALTRVGKSKDEYSYYNPYGNHKNACDFMGNNFWKYFSKRIWQKDNFKFKDIASACYTKHANRYKVKFNPFKFYELYAQALFIEKMGKDKAESFMTKIGQLFENNEEITSEFDGINFKIFKMLYDCQLAGEWNDNAWWEWCNWLIRDNDLLTNLVSVFVHEYLHIILNHLNERIDSRDMVLWNYATDFAINQSCVFTKAMKKMFITDENHDFMIKFSVAAVVHQYKNDSSIKKTISEAINIDLNDLRNSIKSKMKQIIALFPYESSFILNSYKGKSADEYYRILQESELNDGKNKCSGYNEHTTWVIDDSDDDTDMDISEPIEIEDLPEDIKEKIEEMNGGSGIDTRFSKGAIHSGFDAIKDAAKRGECKNAIKDTFTKMGVDVNDINDLLKGVESIPGLSDYGDYLHNFFKVKTKNWKQMLQNCMRSAVNVSEADYTMSRENRIRPDFYPGKRMENGLDCILATDSSGSVGGVDWNDFCNQIKRISKDFNVTSLRVLQCHTRISFDEYVNISKIDKMKVKETGGTRMQVIFERLKLEKNKKLVVLFTDGDIDSFVASLYHFKIIIFLSRGHSRNKENLESLGHTVICQDEE